MPRGRKPRPLHLKLLRGNTSHEAHHNFNHTEPTPGFTADPPSPPDFLSPEALQEWHRVIGELHRLRLVSSLDVAVFAAYCQSYGRWVSAERLLAKQAADDLTTEGLVKTQRGAQVQNPLVTVANNAARDAIRYAAECGCTAIARTRIGKGIGAEPPSKFDGLLA